ncbi:MAG: hypothetical protein H7839_07445 [Magnetococcus sp. YQC-5]
MLKNTKLSTHLLIVLCFVELVSLIMGTLMLRVTSRIEHRLIELDTQDLPLVLAVSEAARQQMDQTLRMNEVLLYAEMDDRQNFEIANEGYIHAGKRLTNVLIEARHISQKGLEAPESDAVRNQLERIKSVLGDLEKIHGSFEHLGGSIIRGQFKYRFLTKAGIITGNATQTLEEAEKEYLQILGKSISDLDDETKRLEGKLKEAFYVTKDLIQNLGVHARSEHKLAWTIFILSMVIFTIGGLVLLLAVYKIHEDKSQEIRNAIRKLAQPFREKADSLLKTSIRLDQALTHLSQNSSQLTETSRHFVTTLTTLESLADQTAQSTVETKTLVNTNEHKVGDAKRSIQIFGEVSIRSRTWGEKLKKAASHLGQVMIQMNLMATSASAEASRLEATRSFIVFTNEIKELAQKALHSVEGIGEQAETSVMDLQTGHELVEKTSKTFQELADALSRLKTGAESVRETAKQQSALVGAVQADTVLFREVFSAYTQLLEDSAGACRMLRAQTESISEVLQEMVVLMDERREPKERRSPREKSLLPDISLLPKVNTPTTEAPPPRQPFEGGDLIVEGGLLKAEKKGP